MQKNTLFIFLLFFSCFTVSSQNRFNDLLDIKPGENFPAGMTKVKKWLEDTFQEEAVSGVQFSQSYCQENTFQTFALINRNPQPFEFPKTEGFKLKLNHTKEGRRGIATQPYRSNIEKTIRAYKMSSSFDLKYSLYEYFQTACAIVALSDSQIIANTLNFMVDRKEKSIIQQFIDDVNKKNKLSLTYEKHDSVSKIADAIKSAGMKSIDVVFKTYIESDNDKTTEKNINRFFTAVGMYDGDVINTVDNIRNYKVKVGMDNPEIISVPTKFMTAFNSSDANNEIEFNFTHIEALLDIKSKKVTIHFFGSLNKPAMMHKGKIKRYDYKKNKIEYTEATNKEGIYIEELIFEISQKRINIEARGTRENYLILNNKL